jgi:hypothetical protein
MKLVEGENYYNGTAYKGLDMEWFVWDDGTNRIATKTR